VVLPYPLPKVCLRDFWGVLGEERMKPVLVEVVRGSYPAGGEILWTQV
jgi:hypothetical protein